MKRYHSFDAHLFEGFCFRIRSLQCLSPLFLTSSFRILHKAITLFPSFSGNSRKAKKFLWLIIQRKGPAARNIDFQRHFTSTTEAMAIWSRGLFSDFIFPLSQPEGFAEAGSNARPSFVFSFLSLWKTQLVCRRLLSGRHNAGSGVTNVEPLVVCSVTFPRGFSESELKFESKYKVYGSF